MKQRTVHDFVQGVRALAMGQVVTEDGLVCELRGESVVPMHTLEYIQEKTKGADGAVGCLWLLSAVSST